MSSLQSSCSAKWFVVAAEQLDNKAVPLSYSLMCNYFMASHVCKDGCCRQGDVYVLSDKLQLYLQVYKRERKKIKEIRPCLRKVCYFFCFADWNAHYAAHVLC